MTKRPATGRVLTTSPLAKLGLHALDGPACMTDDEQGDRQFPDTDEGRRLFYVAITRGSKRWVVLAPNTGASPLLERLSGG